MKMIVDQAYLDEETGMLIEIVKNPETGKIIGRNERYPEPEVETIDETSNP